ncbi:Hypothetical protein GL50581_511 [Giardia duodenalis ATCC 50581]|nr:Hypothetical protein GL50581_511 [Giardia intestinalis ATCC 50581]
MRYANLHQSLKRETHKHKTTFITGLHILYLVRSVVDIHLSRALSLLHILSMLSHIYFWLLVATTLCACNRYQYFPTELDDDQTAVHFSMTEAGLSTYIANGFDLAPTAAQGVAGMEMDLTIGVIKVKISDLSVNELSVESYKTPLVENADSRYLEFTGISVEIQLKIAVTVMLIPMEAVISIGIPRANGYASGQVNISNTCPYHIAIDITDIKINFDEITLQIVDGDSGLLGSFLPGFKSQIEEMLKGEQMATTMAQAVSAIKDSLESSRDYVPNFYEDQSKKKTISDVRCTGFIWGRNIVTLKAGGYTYPHLENSDAVSTQVHYSGRRETIDMPTQLNDKDWQFIIDVSAFKSNLDVNNREAHLYDVQFQSDDLKSTFGKSSSAGHLMVNVTNNASPAVLKVGGAGLKCSFDINATIWLTKSETDMEKQEDVGSLRLIFSALAAVGADPYLWTEALNTTIIYPSFEQITDIKGTVIQNSASFTEGDEYWYKEIGAALEVDYFGALYPILRKTGLTWTNLNFANFSSVQIVYLPETLVLVSGDFFKTTTSTGA